MTPRRHDRPPHSVRVLRRWIAEHPLAATATQARLQRWISFMVVAAVLDRVREENDDPLFLLKGGVAMELRLDLRARATRDYDASFRERAENLLTRLDQTLQEPYGDFVITRAEARNVGTTPALRIELRLATAAAHGRPSSARSRPPRAPPVGK